MKVKDIVLGQRYAVKIVMPSAGGHGGGYKFPRSAPVTQATCVDIAGNTIIFEREAFVPKPGALAATSKGNGLIGIRNYEPGTERLRIPANDVICLSDEWAPPAPDGRIDAPEVHRAAGQTFTSERMAVTG